MEEWLIRGAIAVTSAATGAVIGAVVRPHVEDTLRRRSEARERQRLLINERLERARRELRFAEAIGAFLVLGLPPEQSLNEALGIVGPFFEANDSSNFTADAIDDPNLRQVLRELDTRINGLLRRAFRSTRERESLERTTLLETLPYESLELKDLESRAIHQMEMALGARALGEGKIPA